MIVAFKINGLGDNIVFVPALQALRAKLPGVRIALFTTPEAEELYGGALAPQVLITAKKSDLNGAYRKPWQLIRNLLKVRSLRPEACLISYDQGSVAHFLSKHSGARLRIGADQHNTRIRASLTADVPLPADGCLASWNWEMARVLAKALGDTSAWQERPPVPDLRHLLGGTTPHRGDRRRVVVHPGAGKALTQWSAPHFGTVASSLAADFEVIWICHGAAAGGVPAGCVGAPVKSLGELAGWLSSADLFLGNNSGPMHLADALGCPGVSVAGPSSLGWDPYWHPSRWTVLRHPSLRCAPCEDLRFELLACANLESPMACMRYWTPGMVEAACRERLRGQSLQVP